MANNRKLGAEKEELAAVYLTNHGVKIKERNYRFSNRGEIDIIGYDNEIVAGKLITYLVFFEVKYREGLSKGTSLEAVDYNKQKQICKIADFYRMMNHVSADTSIRYDVVGIDGNNITWIKNAFDHIGKL